MYYAVKYSGAFGYIKPWTAVRDTYTNSMFYLPESALMGIERKLFPELINGDNKGLEKILRYRISFSNLSVQQETTRSINYQRRTNPTTKEKYFEANNFFINRGIMINPVLYLLFENKEDAEEAASQHICLSRNEDLMLPDAEIVELDSVDAFEDEDQFAGYELIPTDEDDIEGVWFGINRYTNHNQYGKFLIVGEPENLRD